MFQPDYVKRLIELGEADAEAQSERVEDFLSRPIQQTAGVEV
jgi:hypothetical protein